MDTITPPYKPRRQKDRANPEFRLSQSALETINKIIIGYAKIQGSVRFQDLVDVISEKRTNVTLAHGFLVDMGIIEGDAQKSSTPLGRELGRALIYGTEAEIKNNWRTVIERNNFCLRVLQDVKKHGEITRNDFQKCIFYFAKYLDPNKDYRVGANTLINIFELSGYVTKSGSRYCVSDIFEDMENKSDQVLKDNLFINEMFISNLESIRHPEFDVTRLVKYCTEINDNFRLKNYSAVIFLCRAILDHCPPIFGFSSFDSLCEQLPTRSSLKEISRHLNSSLKRTADHHIHKQIGKREILPVLAEIDFKTHMNFLIGRIIEKLSAN